MTSAISPQHPRIASVLAERAGVDADSAQIADACVAVWMEIDTQLQAILGKRGVAMLFMRSLHLAANTFSWLAQEEDPRVPMDLGKLRTRLENRSAAEAMQAGNTLLGTFYAVLTSLVGPKLTDNLLRSLWPSPSSGDAAQDISP